MCTNPALLNTLECYMEDMVECFEDFVKKSLFIVTLTIGGLIAMLLYFLRAWSCRTSQRSWGGGVDADYLGSSGRRKSKQCKDKGCQDNRETYLKDSNVIRTNSGKLIADNKDDTCTAFRKTLQSEPVSVCPGKTICAGGPVESTMQMTKCICPSLKIICAGQSPKNETKKPCQVCCKSAAESSKCCITCPNASSTWFSKKQSSTASSSSDMGQIIRCPSKQSCKDLSRSSDHSYSKKPCAMRIPCLRRDLSNSKMTVPSLPCPAHSSRSCQKIPHPGSKPPCSYCHSNSR